MTFNSPHTRAGDTAGSNWVAAYHSGVDMLQRLGDEDGQAVDLLLDRTASVGQTTMYAAPGNDVFDRRVRSVEAILRLIEQMPASEPSADLTIRTLQRIEQDRYATPEVASHPPLHADPRHT
jgi:hypothetical protein